MLVSGMPKLLIISFAFVSLCYSHRLQTVNKNCGHATGTVNYVDVNGCTNEPCVVHPDTQYSITVNFTAKTQITSARNVLHGLFLGLKVKDFPVTPSENCGHGLNCPIQPGQTAAYTISLSFSATDVPVSVKIGSKWELQDANGNDILCFIVPLDVRSN